MKTFTLFWIGSPRTTKITGNTFKEAIINAGYDISVVLNGIDFYIDGENTDEYVFDKTEMYWKTKKSITNNQ